MPALSSFVIILSSLCCAIITGRQAFSLHLGRWLIFLSIVFYIVLGFVTQVEMSEQLNFVVVPILIGGPIVMWTEYRRRNKLT